MDKLETVMRQHKILEELMVKKYGQILSLRMFGRLCRISHLAVSTYVYGGNSTMRTLTAMANELEVEVKDLL